jgi:Tfp pilus assembly protein PilF
MLCEQGRFPEASIHEFERALANPLYGPQANHATWLQGVCQIRAGQRAKLSKACFVPTSWTPAIR